MRMQAAFLAAMGWHCGGDGNSKVRVQDPVEIRDGSVEEPANPCAGAELGMPCGGERHCVAERCALNVCGDGFAYGAEQCDDGNQVAGDGCSPSCQSPPDSCGDGALQEPEECDDGNWYASDACSNDCTENECGNGREDDVEECDDGNRVDEDACANRCTENRCRNGRVDPGEECDDGNTTHEDMLVFSSRGERIQGDVCSNACVSFVCGNGRAEDASLGGSEECDDGNMVNTDACSNSCTGNVCGNKRIDPGELCDGNTASQDCSTDCKTLTQNTACEACRQQHCTNYEDSGLDLVSGCYQEHPSDPRFNDDCMAVVTCAKRANCPYTEADLGLCFCGTFDPGACQTAGNQDGPCIEEIYTAARTRVLGDTIGALGAVDLPVGVAFYLLKCERASCSAECVPKP